MICSLQLSFGMILKTALSQSSWAISMIMSGGVIHPPGRLESLTGSLITFLS